MSLTQGEVIYPSKEELVSSEYMCFFKNEIVVLKSEIIQV